MKDKRKAKRPAPPPERIPDTPENVARILMRGPPQGGKPIQNHETAR